LYTCIFGGDGSHRTAEASEAGRWQLPITNIVCAAFVAVASTQAFDSPGK
jgi:hypothetical protein